MSQKKSKQARKQIEAEQAKKPSAMDEVTSADTILYADGIKKPFLVRFYNWMRPADYTRRQDFHHALVLFIIMVVMIALIILAIWLTVTADERNKQEELVIPKTSFVESQRSDVVSLLEGYGFRVPEQSNNSGDVVAYGTKTMVEQYQQSYYDKNVQRAFEEVENDYDDLLVEGVGRVEPSEDYKQLSINTLFRFEGSGQLSDVLTGTSLGTFVDTMANWCQMKYGERLRVSLVDATGTRAEYRAFENVPSSQALVAMLEKAEEETENNGSSADGVGESPSGGAEEDSSS